MLGSSRYGSTGTLSYGGLGGVRYGPGINVGHASVGALGPRQQRHQQQHSYPGPVSSQVPTSTRTAPRTYTTSSWSPPQQTMQQSSAGMSAGTSSTASHTRTAGNSMSSSPPPCERVSGIAVERRGGRLSGQQRQMQQHRIPSSSPRSEGERCGISAGAGTVGAGRSGSSPTRAARSSGGGAGAATSRRISGGSTPGRGRPGANAADAAPVRAEGRKAHSACAPAAVPAPSCSPPAVSKGHTVSAPSTGVSAAPRSQQNGGARSRTPTSRAYDSAAAGPAQPRTAACDGGASGARRVGSPPSFSTNSVSSRHLGQRAGTPERVSIATMEDQLSASPTPPRKLALSVSSAGQCSPSGGDSAAGPAAVGLGAAGQAGVQTAEMPSKLPSPTAPPSATTPPERKTALAEALEKLSLDSSQFDDLRSSNSRGPTVEVAAQSVGPAASPATVIHGTGGAYPAVNLSSASPSTVDLHGNASGLHRTPSAPESIFSNGGALELSDSLFSSSNSSSAATIGIAAASSAAASVQAAVAQRIAACAEPVRRQASGADVVAASVARTPKRRSRTPEPPSTRRDQEPHATGSYTRSRTSGAERRQYYTDENAPPQSAMDDALDVRTPLAVEANGADARMLQASRRDGNVLTDPSAQSVKMMTSFWEHKLQENQTRASSVDDQSRRPSLADGHESCASSAAGGGGGHGLGGVGLSAGLMTALRNARSEKLKRHLQCEMSRQWKMQEEIARKIQDLGGESAQGDDMGSPSQQRSSESESDTTQLHPAEDDDVVSFLRSFEEQSRSLWRAQRQTVRLLLQCVDKSMTFRSQPTATEPHEPAGEPDAGEATVTA